MNFIKNKDPQIEDYTNIQDYQRDVESYVEYNSESSYDKCLQEINDQNLVNEIERSFR